MKYIAMERIVTNLINQTKRARCLASHHSRHLPNNIMLIKQLEEGVLKRVNVGSNTLYILAWAKSIANADCGDTTLSTHAIRVNILKLQCTLLLIQLYQWMRSLLLIADSDYCALTRKPASNMGEVYQHSNLSNA